MRINELSLSHYSNKVVDKVLPPDNPNEFNHKPSGFWVSVDGEDDWFSWCKTESFRLDHLVIQHRVILAKNASILLISEPHSLDAFSNQYRDNRPNRYDRINWIAVSRDYDGIIIAPYIWSRRLRTMWYYSWDCASGCIWNPSIVESITVIECKQEAA